MRWAFWRRDRPDRTPAAPLPTPPPTPPAPPVAASRGPAARDEPDEDRRPTSPCSGASPEAGRGVPSLLTDGKSDLSGALEAAADDLSLDTAGVRADVLALADAALGRDRAAAQEVLRRLEARGDDEPSMASIAAMAALGDRCATAAGFPSGSLPSGGAATAAVVAQGDTLAARADPLLRAVVPDAPQELVRLVVRFACGVPDHDPVVAHLADAPPEDLALVAAVLLAQTVRDGGGDVAALAEELADLLPG